MTKAVNTVLVKCPLCGEGSEEFEPRGLFGHLRFKHHLNGDKLDKAYHDGSIEEQVEEQVEQQERQALTNEASKLHGELLDVQVKLHDLEQRRVDQASKLHGKLRDVRSKMQDVMQDGGRAVGFSSDEAAKLKQLYQAEEKRLKAELAKLLEEAGPSDTTSAKSDDAPAAKPKRLRLF